MMTNSGSSSIESILAKTKRRESSVSICLAGDLAADFAAAQRDLEEANREPVTSLGDAGRLRPLAEKVEALRKKMLKAEQEFRFRALPRREWSDLLAAHPATPEQKAEGRRYNFDALTPALLAASAVEPAMTVEQAQQLWDALDNVAAGALFDAAWDINTEDTGVPFSALASATLNNSPKK